MSEELIPEPLPLDEQISLELVRQNYTETKLQELEEYLKLDIVEDDKEAYLLVKDRRKEVKAYRVAVEKFCKFKREDAVLIQKAWVKQENALTERLSVVENYLESKEKAYEKKIAEEKEARKRKQEEQLIMRQQELGKMNVLYSGGAYILGEVSFDLAAIKESDDDIWEQSILPLYQEEYSKIEAFQIELDRIKEEKETELKRQQEELEQKQKELTDRESKLKEEADRQAAVAKKAREDKEIARADQLFALGLKFDAVDHYIGYDCFVPLLDIRCHSDEKWGKLIGDLTLTINLKKEVEAEEKRKEQERKELQSVRLTELLPFNKYGADVDMLTLGWLTADEYAAILTKKKREYDDEQEKEQKRISEKAAKAERERIEEEQRRAEVNRKYELRKARMSMLVEHHLEYPGSFEILGEISEETWTKDFSELKAKRDEIIRKQEEERKADELAQASDKSKWAFIIHQIEVMDIPDMRSGQYRKKAAILREKLEEIKAL